MTQKSMMVMMQQLLAAQTYCCNYIYQSVTSRSTILNQSISHMICQMVTDPNTGCRIALPAIARAIVGMILNLHTS